MMVNDDRSKQGFSQKRETYQRNEMGKPCDLDQATTMFL